MAKSLFEQLGGRYEKQGDYLIPCLTLWDGLEDSKKIPRRLSRKTPK